MELNIALTIGLSFLIAGCATGPSLDKEKINLFYPKAEIQYVPELNKTVTAEIGETLISRSYVKKVPAIMVKDIKHSSDFLSKSTWNIPEGILVKYAEGNFGVYYSSPKFELYRKSYYIKDSKGGLLLDSENSTIAEKIYFGYKQNAFYFFDKLKEPVAFKRISPVEIVSEENFRRELIYTGTSKNVITLSYREFKNDMARPAFSQDLKYDLSEGIDIGFKGARFQVLSANNVGITYKVLKSLD